jgi:hypothetical protein
LVDLPPIFVPVFILIQLAERKNVGRKFLMEVVTCSMMSDRTLTWLKKLKAASIGGQVDKIYSKITKQVGIHSQPVFCYLIFVIVNLLQSGY